jgi:pyruvate/2-oxoglutarate dehydrogenase complex dihydrolipoamide acyltransferase (E2) component
MTVLPVIMPKLGAYTEDVLLSVWLVGEGEQVAPGRAIFELETEKTTAEVESEAGGFVHHLVPVGQAVPIGATVALIAETQEEYREVAAAEHVERAAPLVAPRARALLKELGFTVADAAHITGTGPGGRIVDRDVTAWAATRSRGSLTVSETIPLRGRRGTLARSMVESLQTAAQLTSVLEIDVKPIVELRSRSPVGVTAIVVKLVASALLEHPRLNARVTDTAIEVLREINVAVAIDTDDGVVAPVIANADRLSTEETDARIAELARRARDGTLTPDEIADGTFTVSNGGVHQVDITTAILSPPQCGVLWIGRIRERPVVLPDGTIAARPTMQACLTFDHRAVDGAPAAAFLATVQDLVAGLDS